MATAKQIFNKTMKRVDGVIALHPELHSSQGRPRQAVSDLLRGALVLSLAALDALVVDSLGESIPRLAKTGMLGPTVQKWIKEQPDKILACFTEKDGSAALADVCREQLGALTFQRSAAIEGVLADVAGCPPPWEKAAILLTTQNSKWDSDSVRKKLDEYVQRRNRVVHGGDMKEQSLSTQPIQRRYVIQAVEVVRAVGEAVSGILNDRVKGRV